MRYIVGYCDCGYCGCREDFALAFNDNITDKQIKEEMDYILSDYTYDEESVIGSCDDFDSEEEWQEELENFYQSAEINWFEIKEDDPTFGDYDFEMTFV